VKLNDETMMQCREFGARIDYYLDNELSGDELEAFTTHLERCPTCNEELAERHSFLLRLRSAGPLYTSSPTLRRQVESIIAGQTAATPVKGFALYRKIERLLNREEGGFSGWFWSIRNASALATAVVAIAGIWFVWAMSQREAKATAFVDMATKSHQLRLAGQLPLGLRSNSASDVSNWLADKVPVHLRLPNYQTEPGEDTKYTLMGAALVRFQGNKAAYVAYKMQDQLISLIIICKSATTALGGQTTSSRGLTFHTHERERLQVITWSGRNLTYALVSSVKVSGRRSCVVCHPSAKDRELLQSRAGKRVLERVL
jgi:anti-sigma factor RsiW